MPIKTHAAYSKPPGREAAKDYYGAMENTTTKATVGVTE